MPKSGAVVADISAETDAATWTLQLPLGFDAFRTQLTQLGAQEEKLRQPGIEPGAFAWEAKILPLNH